MRGWKGWRRDTRTTLTERRHSFRVRWKLNASQTCWIRQGEGNALSKSPPILPPFIDFFSCRQVAETRLTWWRTILQTRRIQFGREREGEKEVSRCSGLEGDIALYCEWFDVIFILFLRMKVERRRGRIWVWFWGFEEKEVGRIVGVMWMCLIVRFGNWKNRWM